MKLYPFFKSLLDQDTSAAMLCDTDYKIIYMNPAACYPDLMAKYENPIEHTCDVEEGMVWVSQNGEKPVGFCDSAWDSMAYFVKELAKGGGNFYDGWMKNPYSAMISCNDGFRPVSFYLEVLEEKP